MGSPSPEETTRPRAADARAMRLTLGTKRAACGARPASLCRPVPAGQRPRADREALAAA